MEKYRCEALANTKPHGGLWIRATNVERHSGDFALPKIQSGAIIALTPPLQIQADAAR